MQCTGLESRRVRLTAPLAARSSDGADELMMPGEYQSRETGDSVLLCDDQGHMVSQLPAKNFWNSVTWRQIVFLSW